MAIVALRTRLRGFTLIELMAVIVLLGVALALGGMAMGGALQRDALPAAARNLAAALQWTRAQAMAHRHSEALELDLAQPGYQAPGLPHVALPRGTALLLTTALRERVNASAAGIRFFADGTSSGGRILLARGRQRWAVEIAWLTGQVRVHALPMR